MKGGVPETLFENAVGGVWDASPAGSWLLTHSTYQNAMPRTGYADAGLGHNVSVADRVSLHTTLFLSDPSSDVFQAHFSHDGNWVTFNRVNNQHSQIYVPRFSAELVPTSNWIRVTDSTWNDKPRFSWDDKLIFFISDRDGFRCIWAQRLTSVLLGIFQSEGLKWRSVPAYWFSITLTTAAIFGCLTGSRTLSAKSANVRPWRSVQRMSNAKADFGF